MLALTLRFLPGHYSVHRLPAQAPIPALPAPPAFCALLRSDKELSLVCPAEHPVESTQRQDEFLCLRVVGTLDFSLVGVLARLTSCLAAAGISVFAVSSFDTDYLLFAASAESLARTALCDAGFSIA